MALVEMLAESSRTHWRCCLLKFKLQLETIWSVAIPQEQEQTAVIVEEFYKSTNGELFQESREVKLAVFCLG